MVTSVLRYREWSKTEFFVAFFLSAVVVSEIAVILLMGTESWTPLMKMFSSLLASAVATFHQTWKWTYKMVGPMIFPLLSLTFIELWSDKKLFTYWRAGSEETSTEEYYKALKIVEGVAPGFGFLGTCISLIFTMHHMDPNLTQSAMLKVLLDNSSSAFGSTVYGISLAITAFLSQQIFRDFLIQPEPEEPEMNPAEKGEDERGSMNLIRREA